MQGSFTVQFFDLMVHIVPGVVILFALSFLLSAEQLQQIKEIDSDVLLLALGFVTSYVVGFILHIGLTTVQGIYGRLRGQRFLDKHLARDAHIKDAERLASRVLNFRSDDRKLLYRYAQTVVEDQMSSRWTMARRVGALALFSRNLIPVFLVVAAVVLIKGQEIGWLWAGIAAGGALLIIVLLFHTWGVYWRRSIEHTLQAFVFWCQKEKKQRT